MTLLVVGLLAVFGAGAALLPPSFAGGGPGTSLAAGEEADRATAAPDSGSDSGPVSEPQQPTPIGRRTPSALPTAQPSGTARGPAASRSTRATPPSPRPRRTVVRPSTPPPTGVPGREDQVTGIVNAERAKAGCGPVHTDERLRTAARGHSQDMATNNYFSHTSQDGRSPWDRARAAGYTQPTGENIAKGQRTPESVMSAWMNSSGHRSNILNCRSKAVGVGLAYDGSTPVWTQLFGSA